MDRFVQFVLRRRGYLVALCALVTCLAGAALVQRAQLESSLARMFLGEDPRFERYRELSERFGSDEVLALGIEDPQLFEPAGQARLRAAVAALERNVGVRRVASLLDAVYLEPGLPPQPRSYLESALQDPARIPELRARLAKDPGGLLLGRDGSSSAILIELAPAATRKAEGIPELVASVLAPVYEVYPAEQIHRAGTPAMVAEVFRELFSALTLTTPLVALVLLGSVWLLFGRLWPAAISLGVAAIAVVWTLGVAVMIEPQLNIMTAAVPAVILIISFSDIVHLCSAYLLELDRSEPAARAAAREAAILSSASEVGRACLFTSLTTFTGFLCLSFLPVPVFRVLGVVLGLGVGVALLLAVTLVPILFSYLPAPPPLRPGGLTLRIQELLERILAGCQDLALRRPWTIHWVFVACCGLAVAGSARLEIETDFSARLTEGNAARRDQEWFRESFVSADAIQVYVRPKDPALLLDPAWLRRTAAFARDLEGIEGVERVTSIFDLLIQVHRAVPGAAPDEGFPQDLRRIRGLTNLLALGGAESLRPFLDREGGRLRILVHPVGSGMRDSARAAAAVEALARERLPETEVEASGLLALFGGFLDVVVEAQAQGLLISCLTIGFLMVVGLRSIRSGVVSMLPNLLPLGVLTAALALLWDRVDSDAFALTYIALGIGVDDTIHFLVRYRQEAAHHPGPMALRRTFAFAGRGILMTTIILSCGFLPFLLSDYFFMRMLGGLLPLCFVVAVAADLLWIPALTQIGWIRCGPGGTASDVHADTDA